MSHRSQSKKRRLFGRRDTERVSSPHVPAPLPADDDIWSSPSSPAPTPTWADLPTPDSPASTEPSRRRYSDAPLPSVPSSPTRGAHYVEIAAAQEHPSDDIATPAEVAEEIPVVEHARPRGDYSWRQRATSRPSTRADVSAERTTALVERALEALASAGFNESQIELTRPALEAIAADLVTADTEAPDQPTRPANDSAPAQPTRENERVSQLRVPPLKDATPASSEATPAPAPEFDAAHTEARARQQAQAELAERRRERERHAREAAEAEEARRTRQIQLARAEAEQRRLAEAKTRAAAEAEARQTAEAQRQRRLVEEERRNRERAAIATSQSAPTEEPAAHEEMTPRRFARKLREADSLCRGCDGLLEVVTIQFGLDHTQTYARALAHARAVVTEGLGLFADAQINHKPLPGEDYRVSLDEACARLREESLRFAGWRHADSSVEDIVADLEPFIEQAERGLARAGDVAEAMTEVQPQHADVLLEDARMAAGQLSQARDLLDQARRASAEGEAERTPDLTQRGEHAILAAVLVAHRVDDWDEYVGNQRTREVAADSATALRFSLQAVSCYLAALEDFISLHRARVSLAARTMLMLAADTLTRVEELAPTDPDAALRLIDQAEQQAEQADRLALSALSDRAEARER
ncbi:hypothetical protein H8R18_02195 [Nanchangia anserum]|uniref:Uncharacterized protein n=1 Tax=Nanchangia anserum TaxID=2692125 RepID=A0A8I0GC22_9ACTO|nr:hypothetical protein [Nanchangia anserum]MBD3690013.1 hypothetical protein [Nanchangia anserum]QOX82187.1 hypothetical protein H8R18_02195 [Nanchangia anserum]